MFETLKKYLGVIVYIFIITLLFFSCTSAKVNKRGSFLNQKIEAYDSRFKVGSHNFVFLLKDYHDGSPECENFTAECRSVVESTASGLVFSSDTGSVFVLTASHFCDSKSPLDDLFGYSRIVGFANDTPRELYVIKQDKENDLCMLHGVRYESENFYNIKLAKNKKIGESIYTVAAPLGIAYPDTRLIFTGYLGGCNEFVCTTTLPATFGSSGAGIYNEKHELISIIMAVPEGFENVVLSPSDRALIDFIDKIDRDIDIYKW